MNSKIKHLFCRCLHCAHHKVQGLETRHGSKDFQSRETVDCYHQDFPDGTSGRIRLPVLETQETWVWSLGQEDPLEKEVATCSSILASKTPWTEEPCKLYSLLSHKESGMTEWLSIHTHTHTLTNIIIIIIISAQHKYFIFPSSFNFINFVNSNWHIWISM